MSQRFAASLTIAALGAGAIAAPAGAATVAPRGTGAREVTVGRGPGGRAMVLWRSVRGGVRRLEAATLMPSGAFGAPATVLESPPQASDPFGWLDAGGDAHVIAVGRTSASVLGVLDIARAPGAAAFGPPALVVAAPGIGLFATAANGHRDVALATEDASGRIELRTARQGGPFGAAEDLVAGGVAQAPAIAIDAHGDIVVAYTDGEARDVVVRRALAGAPLG